ncbi:MULTISPECIES: flagellar assembly protein FliH [Gracilibacillus]|uniref:flagellar assembly protein FliH n=1 Tax=Gracilibacillus TaxID=74385 RepID=UPI00082547F7|nr:MULTISPECIES: flagellar assembly protein FliH [Gracilibacillus]
MSNFSLPAREIQLKKVQVKPESSVKSSADTAMDLEKQITNKQAELDRLEQHMKQKKEETNQAIEEQKAQWEQERSRYIEQAQQEGYQHGYSQGEIDGQQQYQDLLVQANDTLQIAKQEYGEIVVKSDETILQIALAVAEKVLHEELKSHKEQFIPVAKSLIAQVKDHPQIKLFVPNSVYPLFIENKDELEAIVHHKTDFMIYPAEDKNPYQVMIETPSGKVDASIDSQLDEIRKRLFQISEEMTRESHENME